MDDPQMVQEEPELTVEDEGYEVVVDDGVEAQDEADLKTAELEAQNKELMAKLEAFGQAQQEESKGDQFSDLATAIRELQTPQKAPEPEGVDYNKIIEDVKGKFFDDPTKSVLTLLKPVAEEIQTNADKKISLQSKQISKLTALNTPGDRELMAKYGSEVDQIVGGLPPSENVYQEALKQVKLAHLDDLINEKAQELTQQTIEKAEANVAKKSAAPPVDLSTLPRKGKVRVKMSNKELNFLQNWGLNKGYDWNDSEDRDFIIGYAKEQGWVK